MRTRWGDSFNDSEPVLNHLLNLPEARDTIAAKSANEANMTNGGLNKGEDLFPYVKVPLDVRGLGMK